MQKIRLTESQLNRVILESAVRLIRAGVLTEAPKATKKHIKPAVRTIEQGWVPNSNLDIWYKENEDIFQRARVSFAHAHGGPFKEVGADVIKMMEEGADSTELYHQNKDIVPKSVVKNEKNWNLYNHFTTKIDNDWGRIFWDIINKSHPSTKMRIKKRRMNNDDDDDNDDYNTEMGPFRF